MPLNVITIVIFAFLSFLFVSCLLEALFPKWCWKTFASWKAAEEPSKVYFLRKRVSGVIGMIVAAAIALAPTLIAHLDK